ncbi:sensor histidine kinase [Sphingopyxis sp. MWB1]|uniref:sensor histidine kinase n=1 Tax=Sphingopyxis sp. MWB1 TaxID=1537715 RepID=UPI000AA7A22F|nr:sensor histidine kinase [Sphingopyxis sp. MWB1]
MIHDDAALQRPLADVFPLAPDSPPAPPVASPPLTMRQMVRDFDWASTPLGAADDWPVELRLAVGQMLDSRFPKAIVWGPEYTTIYNDGFIPILGDKHVALGRSFADIWKEAWGEIRLFVERAYHGEPTYIEDFPLVINRAGYEEQCWFTFCYSPLRLADGRVAGMLDTVVETSGKMRAQAELSLINQELGHRLKNTLAIIQSIATQTFAGHGDRGLLDQFNQRLAALGAAHDVLLGQNWSSASLREVASAALRAQGGGDCFTLDGPDLSIGSRSAVTLSLMLHELATNAVKYGALSCGTGRVELHWAVEGDMFILHWQESGGPPPPAQPGEGFGSRLIDRGLGSRSKICRDFAATGLRLRIEAPRSELAG